MLLLGLSWNMGWCYRYMGAADTHLKKLDRIQEKAQKICGCKFRSLQGRRRAASFGLACKLLDGEARGQLQDFAPRFQQGRSRTRNGGNLCLQPKWDAKSLDSYRRSFEGQIDDIFNELPQELLEDGLSKGWRGTMKKGQRLLGKN